MNKVSLKELADEVWDVAIIGSGMGGATAGYALAQKGHRVIVLEKGNASFPGGDHDEHLDEEDPQERFKYGVWPTQITSVVEGRRSRFFGPVGCGAGGSTLLYAAALERLEPNDFGLHDAASHTENAWPFPYETLLPYYRTAEQLFKVRGTQDALNTDRESELLPPPPMSECDNHFFSSFKERGLNPYRLHVGIGYGDKCRECLGFICNQNCKSDAKNICLEPAIQTGNLTLLDQCEVKRLDADEKAAREVVCIRDGKEIRIRARIFIVAAGAYFTPVLLQNSVNNFWPNGLANHADNVGRNLMFHISDFIAVWPKGKFSREGPAKTISLRDFYFQDGKSLGSFQSTGLTVEYGNVIYALKNRFDRSRWSWFKPIRPFLRIPAYLASFFLGPATVFATIMEDRPYPENRVATDAEEPSGMRFEYTVHDELRERIKLFRKTLKSKLAPHRLFVLGEEVSLNYGHPCGTCRMGSDPESSVLDVNCKAHEVDNLYVVDASFMPTSGGANPSLTIAANALRVAEHISERLADTAADEQPGEVKASA
ncbi:MAG TPA: GMC family oxidoreductase [Chromatiales bacterium]|nr:GMC family oxidoreductase [Thiotrichales bacterium]HIP69667.1 GMC family oxidoreductase [Chromatiales bacterium]